MHLFTASQVIRKDGNEEVGTWVVLQWGVYGQVGLSAPLLGRFRLSSTAELVPGSPLAGGVSKAAVDTPVTSTWLAPLVPTPA